MRPHNGCEHGLGLMILAGFSSFYFPHGPPTPSPSLTIPREEKKEDKDKERKETTEWDRRHRERERKRKVKIREKMRKKIEPMGWSCIKYSNAESPGTFVKCIFLGHIPDRSNWNLWE